MKPINGATKILGEDGPIFTGKRTRVTIALSGGTTVFLFITPFVTFWGTLVAGNKISNEMLETNVFAMYPVYPTGSKSERHCTPHTLTPTLGCASHD